jgi:hypothetical protein
MGESERKHSLPILINVGPSSALSEKLEFPTLGSKIPTCCFWNYMPNWNPI